ncbi:hypothetical protein JOM56_000279 [Amanita muscaria]
MQHLNYNTNTYLAVTLSPQSQYFSSPSALIQAHPSLTHVGKVGQLEDVQLYGISKAVWQRESDNILDQLKGLDGVDRVDVQSLQVRSKRGGDEL